MSSVFDADLDIHVLTKVFAQAMAAILFVHSLYMYSNTVKFAYTKLTATVFYCNKVGPTCTTAFMVIPFC